MSILRPCRLERLRRSGCVYVAPGVESWFDYRSKSGVGSHEGRSKLEEVVARFQELERCIGGVQANFILGTDGQEFLQAREPIVNPLRQPNRLLFVAQA